MKTTKILMIINLIIFLLIGITNCNSDNNCSSDISSDTELEL